MNNHLVNFEQMEWLNPVVGVRFKQYVNNNRKIRLLEFSEGFIEKDYCLHVHIIYVLEGPFTLDFNGKIEKFRSGDTIMIPYGDKDMHKAVISKNEKVLLLLFEQVDNL